MANRFIAALGILIVAAAASQTAHAETHTSSSTPGAEWERLAPAEAELDANALQAVAEYLGGRGFIARYGYEVFSWGDSSRRGDVASAAKPLYAHFLLKAIERELVGDLDDLVAEVEPRLNRINAELDYKDRAVTWRHLVTQTACYGLTESPGSAYAYNDWQMALFVDALFLKVFGASWESVDERVFHPMLATPLRCQDAPTLIAFGVNNRAGRLAISPRDFARLGLLYLREGEWNGDRLLAAEHARMAVSSPLPAELPRAGDQAAEMIDGQRTIGSDRIPDNQTDHFGSYSYLWWVNGVDRDGRRRWPDAPEDVFAALGHRNGMRGMAVLPSLDLVISWNDSRIGDLPEEPHPLNEAFCLLVEAVGGGLSNR